MRLGIDNRLFLLLSSCYPSGIYLRGKKLPPPLRTGGVLARFVSNSGIHYFKILKIQYSKATSYISHRYSLFDILPFKKTISYSSFKYYVN